MIPFSPALIKLGLIAVLIAGAYVTGCTHEKERFDQYKLMVKAVGEAQEARTRERIASDKLKKEKVDRDHKTALGTLKRDRDRLQRQLASGSVLPAASPGTRDPSRVTLDRAEFDRAFEQFARELSGIAEEGDKGIAGLNAAKRWVRPE